MSAYGKQVVEKLFTVIRDYELITISGLADGTDQLCHELSIEYSIPTIAVLA
jgi:predicted Rossmann fold nucleotide-binding protein DprA/Smf involved in DNA uptake